MSAALEAARPASFALCPCGRRLSGPADHEGRWKICPGCLRSIRLISGRETFQPWKRR